MQSSLCLKFVSVLVHQQVVFRCNLFGHARAYVCVDTTSTLLNTCREPGVQTRGVPRGFMCLHAFCNTKCRFHYGSQHRKS